ncbi:MAG: WbqC family protein [Bacteroidaceae bacterium]|nr:WbqC family protein [Bacteroidaceae bacterium]
MQDTLLCSAYLPPVSFFTAIKSGGDVLIEQYDNYCKQTYRNRCVIATAGGRQALTIPVVKSESPKQLMKDVRISDHGEWRRQHWNALESAYMNSPFFMYYQDDFRPFYEKKIEFLVDFNTELTELILKLAGINKEIKLTGSFGKNGADILDLRGMIEPGINEPASPRPYWQVFKQKYGFIGNLSAVDLLFNMGPEFPLYL